MERTLTKGELDEKGSACEIFHGCLSMDQFSFELSTDVDDALIRSGQTTYVVGGMSVGSLK
jgi:hypothetical protein